MHYPHVEKVTIQEMHKYAHHIYRNAIATISTQIFKPKLKRKNEQQGNALSGGERAFLKKSCAKNFNSPFAFRFRVGESPRLGWVCCVCGWQKQVMQARKKAIWWR